MNLQQKRGSKRKKKYSTWPGKFLELASPEFEAENGERPFCPIARIAAGLVSRIRLSATQALNSKASYC